MGGVTLYRLACYTGATLVGLMVDSPGRREMEGTNDCTVGRGQRPDIAILKARSKPSQPTVWEENICTI